MSLNIYKAKVEKQLLFLFGIKNVYVYCLGLWKCILSKS